MRTYKKKGEAMAVSETAVKKALEEVVKGLKSIREAAKSHGITKTTLGRRLKKLREQTKDKNAPDVLLHSGLKLLPTMNTKHSSRQIFTVAQERLLTEYLIKCSKLSYGLTMEQLRRLAFGYAKQLGKFVPQTWEENKTAGCEWAAGFLKRNR